MTVSAIGLRLRLPLIFVESLAHRKAEVLEILSASEQLPDHSGLIDTWKLLRCPRVPLSHGIDITDLPRWLNPWDRSAAPSSENVAKVWAYLLEYLPPGEVAEINPLLEEWRRSSIPMWRANLREAMAEGRKGDETYCRWMLTEILGVEENEG